VRLVVAAIVLLFTATLGAGCGGGKAAQAETAPKPKFQGHAVTTPAPDFTLRDARGQEVSLSSQRGKLVLITFLYTNCPDVCPLIAENLNRALRQLGPERSEVRVLAVSVDPKGDTAKAVRAYEKLHHLVPEFRYLVGSRKELAAVWAEYKVTAVASDPELVDHVAYTLLVDRSGKGRVLYGSSVRSAQVAHDLRVLLAT
jgi:protein SCO1